MESRFPRNDERRPGIGPVGRRSDPPGDSAERIRTAIRLRYVCALSVYQTDEAPGCHTRQPGASFCWRSLGILSTKPPGGASVESVRRHPRAGTRIRLVLVPSRNPGRFAPKLRGGIGCGQRPRNRLARAELPRELPGGGVPPVEPVTFLSRRTGRPPDPQSNAPAARVNAFDFHSVARPWRPAGKGLHELYGRPAVPGHRARARRQRRGP